MAALGSQSIASSYEQLLHVDRDGGGNTTTHVSIKDGDNGTTFGFTIASDALMMTSTNRLEFGDTGTYIHQSADGVLDLVSDTEIEINATTIDMNGALDLSGNAQLSGTVTVGADGSGTDVIFYSGTAGDNFSWDASEEKLTITGTNGQTALDVADGNLVVADNVDIEGDIDVNGTTNLDAVDIDGAVQIDAAVTVGADDQGYDFKFFGDTASAYMMWDTSADDLVFAGAAGIDLDGDIDVNGTANLDNTDIDGTLTQDAGNVVFNEDSADYDFRVESSGNANMLFVDGGSDAVGIGTATPDYLVEIEKANGDHTSTALSITNSQAGGYGSALNFVSQRASGTTRAIAARIRTQGNASWADADNTDSNLFFSTVVDGTLTDRMSISGTAADVTIGTGDIVFATAGKGICLGVTSNTDANTLDDYEEGTWTVAVTGSSSGSFAVASGEATGSYTKIGRLVNIQGGIQIESESSCSGSIQFSLPVASGSGAHHSERNYGTAYLINGGGTIAGKTVTVNNGSSAVFVISIVADDGTAADLDNGDVDESWFLGFSHQYWV